MKKITKNDDFETRVTEVLFNGGDESLLTESEVFEIYDTITEWVLENHGELPKDYHFKEASLPQKTKILH